VTISLVGGLGLRKDYNFHFISGRKLEAYPSYVNQINRFGQVPNQAPQSKRCMASG